MFNLQKYGFLFFRIFIVVVSISRAKPGADPGFLERGFIWEAQTSDCLISSQALYLSSKGSYSSSLTIIITLFGPGGSILLNISNNTFTVYTGGGGG